MVKADLSPSRHVNVTAVPTCCLILSAGFRKAAEQSSVRFQMVSLHNSVVVWKPVSAGGPPYWTIMGMLVLQER